MHVKVFTVLRIGHGRTPLEATKEATTEIENGFRAGTATVAADSTRSSGPVASVYRTDTFVMRCSDVRGDVGGHAADGP
jgi:hypothetical protein